MMKRLTALAMAPRLATILLLTLTLTLTLTLGLTACAVAPAPGPAAARTPSAADPQPPFLPSAAQFEQLFPQRLPFYTYAGFVAAVNATPGFAQRGPEAVRRREMAAFLAQIAHESDSLQALREYARENWDRYCHADASVGCAPGRQYYGRGPIQLSWNTGYHAAGQAIGVDLWADPDRVATDPKIAWQTALWYWMTQSGPGRMSAHRAMVDGVGFGETTRSINGALECDRPADATVARKLARRIEFFRRAAALLQVDPGPALSC